MKKKLSFPAVFMGGLIQPRQTIREVIQNEYYSFIMPFIFVYALMNGFNPIYAIVFSKFLSFPEAVVVGFFFSLWFDVYRLSFLFMGRLLDGKQDGRKGNLSGN